MIWSQSSYAAEHQGILYLVPTPIGNLEDITFRALEVLKTVDYIACEDTRHTRKLLNHFQIDQMLVSYHEHNKKQQGSRLISDLKQGKRIALVTDAGMPAISDPGEDLVQQAVAERIPVISLPGANAALTGLVASGLSTRQFLFCGFLERKPKARQEQLAALSRLPYTLIFYEAPHRLVETLEDMVEILGDRRAVLVRELTKRFEEYIRGTLGELYQWAQDQDVRGECTLIVDKGEHFALTSEQPPWWQQLTIKEHVEHYIEQGYAPKEAIKQTSKERQLPRREVYHLYHGLGQDDGQGKQNP
ncbi:Ribosomal RNA small subunit methyltransferase I [Caldalkalibacillus thermarum TA2.A1]|uniref:Ribosomal RNA small subunit methyltransferase I n=1 Tax=Caldalkalibacillus thermarum (strain TA2.A1) TaxID=986075 RepID=F5L9X6_CALTT|nr:16S rRNA (cytidine(1402)-2'-O)-methyltransferase [Caldalkalibacillus thermarum]EGL81846.1 Ribosomal RNA small subunit methyltransferase I [Caldalkalibacillus thermarum TA2.A1]QZT34335.1 16S rRNA (cytidine(1402)-2'-O)-methyltransferase [Caldalkalibacillus thermarum TA2.A1]GGK31955.1 ribosomal RNA small subunit methyltransferase I [Caldalkalibacillus thermarum]